MTIGKKRKIKSRWFFYRPEFLIPLVSVRVLGVQRGVPFFRHALTTKLVARKAGSVRVRVQRSPSKTEKREQRKKQNNEMTNKKNFPKQSKQKIKRDVLAGVGGRFRIAGTSIGSHGCFRQGTLGRLRLLGIGPRSVASIRRSRALTTGTTNVIIGMLLLLPRQVHGRIRCRGH